MAELNDAERRSDRYEHVERPIGPSQDPWVAELQQSRVVYDQLTTRSRYKRG